jgi:hypothetical protein
LGENCIFVSRLPVVAAKAAVGKFEKNKKQYKYEKQNFQIIGNCGIDFCRNSSICTVAGKTCTVRQYKWNKET